MKSLKEISARLEAIADESQVLSDQFEAGEIEASVAEEQIASLDAEYDELKSEQSRVEKFQARLDKIKESRITPAVVEAANEIESGEPPVADLIPARAKAFKSKHFASSEDAYVSGMYLAHLNGNQKAGEILAAQSIGTDDKGGFTVPDPLAATLINLLEEYGVARRVCKRIVMSSSTWTVPKVLGHASVSYPGEAGAITDSDVTFGQVNLVATKIASLVKMSTEVTEDSVISVMDTVVQSMAYSIAIAEDQNLFNGVAGGVNADGIKGNTDVVDTNVASVAALALSDFIDCSVSVGNPVVGASNEWYINSTLYNGPVRELLDAAPGNTSVDFASGTRPTLLGYPVNYVNVLPGASASTAGDLLAVFGDASLGCYFGDRRALSFRTLNELYANNDQVGVQCTERIDVKVANPEVLAKITITG